MKRMIVGMMKVTLTKSRIGMQEGEKVGKTTTRELTAKGTRKFSDGSSKKEKLLLLKLSKNLKISKHWLVWIMIGLGFLLFGQIVSILSELSSFWEILPQSIRSL